MKTHTITCEFIRNEEKYIVKATQQLGNFDIGHYAGYVESVKSSNVIGVFQSTNSPKEKITIKAAKSLFNS